MMLYISPLLTGFSFGLFLFVGIGIGWLSKSLRKNSLKAQFSLGNLLSIIDEGIGGLRVIKAFTAEKYQEEKFKLENNNYRVISNTIQRRKELASPLSEFLGICVIAALLLFGGNLVFNGQFEASTFVMFILMFYNIIDPAKSFASAVYEVQKGRAAAERINEIIQTEASIKDNPEAAEIKSFNNEISIENLSFSYDEQSEVLKNINLSIKKGKRIALVGMSGSGKSTLADLLIRFQDPTTGQIKLDGIDIKKYKMKDLRQLFGIVTQEPILFHDSILNNIKFGLENVSEEAIMNAAKIANAHDFILQTEHGYQTVIGDRGMKLSGGQRQRLTLARAILRNPQILILDEATSSLDSESEKAVQIALENILKDRTSVIIAHRLSTIQNADEIIVLDAGQIVETGSHEELLQKNGFYRKMVDLQRL
jgi:subfamily B ATP-binding cassette protein MsbA